MMKISCFSDEIASRFDDQLRVISDLGMNFFEVRTVDDIPVLSLSDFTCREIRKKADDLGMTITCVASPIGKNPVSFPLDESVEQVKRASEIAEFFGCNKIRIFSFFKEEGRTLDEEINMSAERLCAMAETAKDFGTVLVMEGGHNTVGEHGKDSLTLFQRVNNASLRCAFDAAAFVASGDTPLTDCLPQLLPYVEYMHMKDCRFGESKRVVVGEGDGQIDKILDQVRDMDLVLSLEPHLDYAGATRGFSGEMPFRQAHKALINMLERLKIDYI